jgi:hypothetical protein
MEEARARDGRAGHDGLMIRALKVSPPLCSPMHACILLSQSPVILLEKEESMATSPSCCLSCMDHGTGPTSSCIMPAVEREREQTSLLTRDFVALDLAGCNATSLSLSSNLSACCLCMAKRYTCVAWNYLLVDKTVSHQQHPAYRYQSTTGRLGLHYIHSFNFPTSLTRQW